MPMVVVVVVVVVVEVEAVEGSGVGVSRTPLLVHAESPLHPLPHPQHLFLHPQLSSTPRPPLPAHPPCPPPLHWRGYKGLQRGPLGPFCSGHSTPSPLT